MNESRRKINEYVKNHRDKNREAYNKYMRDWVRNNPDKYKANRKKSLEKGKKENTEGHKKRVERLKKLRGDGTAKRKADHDEYYKGAEKAKMRNKNWDLVDECMVLEKTHPDKVLSEMLGRSLRAIQIKRCKLLKAEHSED